MIELSDSNGQLIMIYRLTQNIHMTLEQLAELLLSEIRARGLEGIL
jgi:hypothetical protein